MKYRCKIDGIEYGEPVHKEEIVEADNLTQAKDRAWEVFELVGDPQKYWHRHCEIENCIIRGNLLLQMTIELCEG